MSRPKDRQSAAKLLTLMESRPWKDGKTVTYRYHPIGGKPINLGQDHSNAIRKVLDLLGSNRDYGTLKWVWEKYSSLEDPAETWEVLADLTKVDYKQAWMQIEKSLGLMNAQDITSNMVARYVHTERKSAPKRANTERALLSNLLAHGILLGVCSINAATEVKNRKLQSRTVKANPKVLEKFLEWLDTQTPQRRIVGMAAEFASLAGSRQIEFRPLSWSDINHEEGVIRLVRAKQRGTKKGTVIDVISISPAISALLVRLKQINPERDCHYVFPNEDGNQYSAKGFQVLWQRCIAKAMEIGIISQETRFTFHDLRAHYVTKHKNSTGVLPDLHKNPQTTALIYDRNEEVPRDAV